MNIMDGVDQSDPSVVSIDEIGKERELRALRKRVEDLELRLVKHEGKVAASLALKERVDEKHGYQCGFHPHVLVSDETNLVECAICHEPLDPLDVLREFARHERNFVFSINTLRAEQTELRKQVDQLKKQRSSLWSQVKKRGGKVPDYPGWP